MPSNIFVSCTVWPQEKISWGISFLRNTEILNNGFRYLYFLPMECAVFTAKNMCTYKIYSFEAWHTSKKWKKASNCVHFIAMWWRDFYEMAAVKRMYNSVWTFKKKSWENLQRTSPFNVERLSSLSLSAVEENFWIIHAISGVWFASVVEVHFPGK